MVNSILFIYWINPTNHLFSKSHYISWNMDIFINRSFLLGHVIDFGCPIFPQIRCWRLEKVRKMTIFQTCVKLQSTEQLQISIPKSILLIFSVTNSTLMNTTNIFYIRRRPSHPDHKLFNLVMVPYFFCHVFLSLHINIIPIL